MRAHLTNSLKRQEYGQSGSRLLVRVIVVWLVAVGVLGDSRAAGSTQAPGRPNILVIMADDMGFSDTGCFGGEIATPSIDGLAKNGLRFTQMYSTARCSPSRTALLTGYYYQQVSAPKLPGWATTLASRLKTLGYRGYHSGKWHLHATTTSLKEGGFDRSYRLNGQDNFFRPKSLFLDDRPVPAKSAHGPFYMTAAIADHAVDFLKSHTNQGRTEPFFLYLAFTSPHFPLHAPAAVVDKYTKIYRRGWDAIHAERVRKLKAAGILSGQPARPEPQIKAYNSLSEPELQKRIGPGELGSYRPWDSLTEEQKEFQAKKMAVHAAMIDQMDEGIGRVLDQLRSTGQFDNTFVIFLSDNGASAEQIIRGDGHKPGAAPGSAESYLGLGPAWSWVANTPHRLHKIWVHEGGIAGPCVVHWPQGIRGKGELRHPISHFIDVLPTLLELAGQKAPSRENGAPPFPGRSLVKFFSENGTDTDRPIYFNHAGNRALRFGQWKLVSKGKNGPWELYQLPGDRAEQHDLSAKFPDKVRALATSWKNLDDEYLVLIAANMDKKI